MSEPAVLAVVGAGGLLGSAVTRQAARRGVATIPAQVPWTEPPAARRALSEHVREVLDSTRDVALVWCAGAGVVGTGADELAEEVGLLRHLLAEIEARATVRHRVRLMLTSSAGGVYAGATDPPFTESTGTAPLAPYGEAKLEAEAAVTEWTRQTSARAVIARAANLYGPGQDLTKKQGLISQLCRAQLERESLTIYVSLDTAKDYIYVDDAAAIMLDCLARAEWTEPGSVTHKIICSGASTTLASVLGELRRVSRRPPPIVLGASQQAHAQSTDLHFRSVVWPDLDTRVSTPLPAGIHATYQDIASQLFTPESGR